MRIAKTKLWTGIALIAIAIGATAWWWGCGGSASRNGDLIVTNIQLGSVTTVTNGQGSLDITVNFDPTTPIPSSDLSGIAITVADASGLGTAPVVSNLACPEGGTVCTATISGLAGCMTLADYTVTVTVGANAYSGTFNSASDDFLWPTGATVDSMIQSILEPTKQSDLTKCWAKNSFYFGEGVEVVNDITVDTTTGQLTIHYTNAGGHDSYAVFLEKIAFTNIPADRAFILKYASNNVLHSNATYSNGSGFLNFSYSPTASWMGTSMGGNIAADGGLDMYDGLFYQSGSFSGEPSLLLRPIAAGVTYDAGYLCSVSKGGVEKAYYSADGVTFYPMDATWMTPITTAPASIAVVKTPPPALTKTEPSFPTMFLGALGSMDMMSSGSAAVGNPSFSSTFDMMRFKTTGLVGSDADCLSMLTYGVTKVQ